MYWTPTQCELPLVLACCLALMDFGMSGVLSSDVSPDRLSMSVCCVLSLSWVHVLEITLVAYMPATKSSTAYLLACQLPVAVAALLL